MKRVFLPLFCGLLVAVSTTSFAQTQKTVSPDSPDYYETIKNKKKVTPPALTDSIINYVNSVSKKNDGYFPATDDYAGKKLDLTLLDVHEDCYADMGDDIYFVCANFEGTDSNVYDVDFFFKKENGKMVNTMTKVHKVNEIPYYNWYQDGQEWKTMDVKYGDEDEYHPETDRPFGQDGN